PPDRLYLADSEWRQRLDLVELARLTPFAVPEGQAIDVGARQGHDFAAERTEPGRNVFEAVTQHVTALQAAKKRVVIALWSAGSPHDCLEIHYAGGDKLFLPVENIELLSRYGSEEAGVELDRLGSGGWQTRKARMKSRIREIANELIKIAAERLLREAPKLAVEPGPYEEF